MLPERVFQCSVSCGKCLPSVLLFLDYRSLQNQYSSHKKRFFAIVQRVHFFMYLSSWFVLFVIFALCTCLGPFEYCSNIECFTAVCCAVSHVSAKLMSGPDCNAHQ